MPADTAPAPWAVVPEFGGTEPDPEDWLLCFHSIRDANGNHVASTWAGPHEANARLIAAAPALYSGCSALLGLIQLVLNRNDLSAELRAALQPDNHRIAEAEAALALARGESKP